MKRCTKCKVERPEDKFSVDDRRKDKLQPWCKVCYDEYRETHHVRIIAQKQGRRDVNWEDVLEQKGVYRRKNKDWINTRQKEKRRQDPARAMYHNIKKRAKKAMILFNLTPEYIAQIWPADNRCPIFQTEFVIGGGDTSPSLDKLIPELGYVQGNVSVISKRANEIKRCEVTPKSFWAIAIWLEKRLKESGEVHGE